MVGMALLAVAVVLTLRAGHGPGRGTLAVARGRPVADPGPGGADRGGAGRRGGHHRDRSPRRGQGGQADPHRPRGHDPHPRRDRARRRRGAAGPALGAVADRRPRPRPGRRAGPAGRHGRPGDHRLHPVLHPPARRAGRHPRPRGLHGVVHRPLVPPRPVRPPARGRAGPRPARCRAGRRPARRTRWRRPPAPCGTPVWPGSRCESHRAAAAGDRRPPGGGEPPVEAEGTDLDEVHEHRPTRGWSSSGTTRST